MDRPAIIVLMGVAGSGKTTIGELLSRKLRWPFFDADDFHPPGNVAKMAAGIPLMDEDRWPWLENLRRRIEAEAQAGQGAVFACSALKQSYRDFLAISGAVRFVFLKGAPPLIAERIRARKGHFMKPEMLAGQLADLEEPVGCLTIDVSSTPQAIVDEIIDQLERKEE